MAQVARPTQSFVHVMSWVKKHPMVVLFEVLWRWVFGVPLLWIGWQLGQKVGASPDFQATNVGALTVNRLLTDPMGGSNVLARALLAMWPVVQPTLVWAVPVFLVYWAIVSGVGRTLVMRRMDPSLRARPLSLVVLNFIRLVPLAGTVWLWWATLSAVAQRTILQPAINGGEPQVMLYVGVAIVLTLGLFVAWAGLGWVFSMAPLIVMLHGEGPMQSLRSGLRVGALRGRLVEINLVLSVVKIALLILLMVFSATPLPFQSIATEDFLVKWTMGVGVLYFIASDFFHVARLAGYLHLWRDSANS